MSHRGRNDGCRLPVAPAVCHHPPRMQSIQSCHSLGSAQNSLICDDLRHFLHTRSIHVDPTEEDVFDYGLYLIEKMLSMSLQNSPDMPQVQQDWGAIVGN